MTITINGTTGIAGVDGSASVPAFQGNDTDTGIFYPAANEVAAAAGGSAVWNASSTFGFKNRVINGEMCVWQRGTSSSTPGAFVADRWSINSNNTTSAQSSDAPTGFRFSNLMTATSASNAQLTHRIESLNCADLVGNAITVSFWAKSTAGSTQLGVYISHANSQDNFGATTNIGSTQNFTLTSSWVRYSVTFTSSAPSGVANGVQVGLFRNGTESSTTYITGVQLERGSTATSFDFRPYGTELMLCQRYYEKSYDQSVAPGSASTSGYSSGNNPDQGSSVYIFVTDRFAVTKRATATMRVWDLAGNQGRTTQYTLGGLGRTDNANNIFTYTGAQSAAVMIFVVTASTASTYQWDASAEL